jgi:hypothetical protein
MDAGTVFPMPRKALARSDDAQRAFRVLAEMLTDAAQRMPTLATSVGEGAGVDLHDAA